MNRRKLSELDPDVGPLVNEDGTRSEGVTFDCPACEGLRSHSIYVPWSGVSPFPSGAMWKLVDANLATLTLTPSVDLDSANHSEDPNRCRFHGFVTNGEVTW
jgi:hypothetical protein